MSIRALVEVVEENLAVLVLAEFLRRFGSPSPDVLPIARVCPGCGSHRVERFHPLTRDWIRACIIARDVYGRMQWRWAVRYILRDER